MITNLAVRLDWTEFDKLMNKVYVFPCFLKPGRSIYAVAYPDEKGNPSFFVHKLITKPREEEVAIYEKPAKIQSLIRQFDKSKTIFREWIIDTPKTCLDCILHDMQYWKISRFTKPPEDIVNIENIFKAHA